MSAAPPTLSPVHDADEPTKSLFHETRHEILHKLWELHKDDEVHQLNQAREVEHLKHFKLIKYRTEEVPYGVNYFGKIILDDQGHCIHVRLLKSSEGTVKFHAVHTRPTENNGAVFSETDEITYFEY